MSPLVKFFDKLEDRARERLSRTPVLYAVIGGVFVVLFWRAVWLTADLLMEMGGALAFIFSPGMSLILSVIGLLSTGLFVSFFISNRVLLTGLKHEKKLAEKTAKEVLEEEAEIQELHAHIARIEKRLDDIIQK